MTIAVNQDDRLTAAVLSAIEQHFISRGYLDQAEVARYTSKAQEITFEKESN